MTRHTRSGTTLMLALLLLVAPAASAQMMASPAHEMDRGLAGVPPDHVMTQLRVEGPYANTGTGFLVVGVDTTLNLTIRNGRAEWINDTIRFNYTRTPATGADSLDVSVPPKGVRSYTFPVHAEDVGLVQVTGTFDATYNQMHDEGHTPQPIRAQSMFTALPAVSVAIVDPAPESEDDEYRRLGDPYGRYPGEEDANVPQLRLGPGDTYTFRLEVRNLQDTTTPGFTLTLGTGREPTDVEVEPLEPGEVREVTFEDWSPTGGSIHGYGSSMSLGAEFRMSYKLGGNVMTATAGAFTIRNGAVESVTPAALRIMVTNSVAVEVYVPKSVELGTPGRYKVNVTYNGEEALTGARVTITLKPPHGLHYGVQGPESFVVELGRVPSGTSVERVFEFTPRVTGSWTVDRFFESGSYRSMNGGAGFMVESPLVIGMRTDREGGLARMSEPIQVDVIVGTRERLDNAELHVAASTRAPSFVWAPKATGGMKGMDQRIAEASPERVPLGTLRAGDVMDATFTVSMDGSGMFTVVPYVIANGFAYTHTHSSSQDEFPEFWGAASTMQIASSMQIAVAPRVVPTGLALAPFTVLLGVVVGAWTLRTRFVK